MKGSDNMFQYDIKAHIIDYKLANLDQLETDFKHTYNKVEINKERLIEYKVLTKNGLCVKVQLFENINQLYLYLQGYLEALNAKINLYTYINK